MQTREQFKTVTGAGSDNDTFVRATASTAHWLVKGSVAARGRRARAWARRSVAGIGLPVSPERIEHREPSSCSPAAFSCPGPEGGGAGRGLSGVFRRPGLAMRQHADSAANPGNGTGRRDPERVRARPLAARGLAAGLLVTVAGLLALPLPAQAQTQTLVSNVGQNTQGNGSLFDFDQAQAFTTGSNSAGYTLTSVKIDMGSEAEYATAFTVSVYSNSSGVPGTSLGTLSNPASLATDGVHAFTTRGIALAASTTYFVVIDRVGTVILERRLYINNTNSNAEDAGKASGWSIGNGSLYRDWDSSGSWTSFGDSKKIRVKGYNPEVTNASISIADASAAENAGHLMFDVTLSRSFQRTVKVDFETISGGTATEGDDYHARRTYTHVIVAGDRTAQMGFALIEDTVTDAGETVKVKLSNARRVDAYGNVISFLDITSAEATGTITAPATSTTDVSNLTIRIDNTTGDEDDGWLDFRVRLSRKYDKYVCYDFETISGGTATEGRDYNKRPKVGQWVQIGKRVDKPFVRIIDDAINDDGETVKVKISNARLCNDASKTVSIANAEATGTINNSDPMPLAWMVRFGRTVGSQVVDALGQRLDGATASHVTVGGINLTGAPGAAPEAQSDDPFGLPEWAKGTQREESEQSLTANELLLGNAFHLSSGGGQGEGPAYTAWGRVARSGFEAEVDDVTMDADVTSGLIGFDAEWERVLAGVMLSQSSGEGSYRLDPQKGDDAGTVKSSLSGVYPYVQLDLNATVSAWALAGAGSGDLTLHQDDGKPMPTDITMRMGAVGFKGQVLDGTGAERARDEREIRRHVGRDEERTHDRSDRQRRQRQPTAAHRRGQAHLRGRQRGEDHPKRRAGASPRRRRRGDRHRAGSGRGVELRRGAAYRRRPGADAGRARGVRIRGVGRERGDAHHAQHVRPGTDAQHRA